MPNRADENSFLKKCIRSHLCVFMLLFVFVCMEQRHELILFLSVVTKTAPKLNMFSFTVSFPVCHFHITSLTSLKSGLSHNKPAKQRS